MGASSRFAAIIPAAGRSGRMGKPKLLLPWREQTILDAVLAAWNASHVDRILVVAGELAGRYAPIVTRYGAELVVPKPPPAEMIESVQAGLRAVGFEEGPADTAWLVAPADQPCLSPELINRLLEHHDPNSPAVLLPTDGSSRGHPVLFPAEAASAALRLESGRTLRDVVARFAVREVAWADSRAWADVDTPADYRRLLGGD